MAAVARTGEHVAVAPDAYERTGLGARATFSLPAEELAEFSVRTMRGRANAVGPPLPREVVRAALVVRCNGIVNGGSGVQPAVL